MISIVNWDRPNLERKHLGAFLRHEPEGIVGETFCYNQPCTWSAARAVAERTGTDIHDLLRERVFGPLGIEHTCWARDADGHSLGFSGLHVTTEHIASFFQLLLDDGVRDGERLLPVEWVEQHRRRQVANGPEGEDDWTQGYGWQVWIGQHGYRGDGAFGQFGLVLPDHDMVVAITSAVERMQSVLDAAWAHLLPGVDRPGDEAGQAALDGVLGSLALAPVRAGDEDDDAWEPERDWSRGDRDRPTLAPADDGWTCTWSLGSDVALTFPVGDGRWVESRLDDGTKSLRVAASGARTEGGHVVDLVILTSPHRACLFIADDGELRGRWRLEPLGAPLPWGLAQPFTD